MGCDNCFQVCVLKSQVLPWKQTYCLWKTPVFDPKTHENLNLNFLDWQCSKSIINRLHLQKKPPKMAGTTEVELLLWRHHLGSSHRFSECCRPEQQNSSHGESLVWGGPQSSPSQLSQVWINSDCKTPEWPTDVVHMKIFSLQEVLNAALMFLFLVMFEWTFSSLALGRRCVWCAALWRSHLVPDASSEPSIVLAASQTHETLNWNNLTHLMFTDAQFALRSCLMLTDENMKLLLQLNWDQTTDVFSLTKQRVYHLNHL